MHVAYNLLHLVPGETGGAEVYARRLLPALREERIRPRDDPVRRRCRRKRGLGDGVDVVPLRFDPRSRVRRVLAEQTLLPRAVRDSAPDLLHNLFNTAPAVTPVPQVTTIHDVIHHRHPDSGLLALGLKAAVPLAARRSSRILTVSEASKTDIVRFLGVPADRIDVAPNGPGIREDTAGVAPDEVRRRFEVGNAPLVLTVAPSRPHKNVPRLVEALALLPDVVLVVPGYPAGGDRSSTTWPSTSGWQTACADRAGSTRRRSTALPGGRLLRLPLARRGLRAPVLEAMIRGAPVACSNATSLPEVAGEAALYFDPTDVEAIAVSVQRLLEDEELADELRAAGLERAKRFSWDETARRTLACYRKAVAR